MSRRCLLRISVVTLVIAGALWATPVQAASLTAGQMRAALRTASPEDDGFIDRVLGMVDDGDLPESLVISSFQWARKKSSNRFQYFRRALTVQASRRGIRL